MTPIAGASGIEQVGPGDNAIAQRNGAAKVERLDVTADRGPRDHGGCARPSRRRATTPRPARRGRTRRRRADPRDTSASGAPGRRGPPRVRQDGVRKKIRSRRGPPPPCCSPAATWTSSQSAPGASRAVDRKHRVHQVDAGEIDDPGMCPGGDAGTLVTLDHIAPRDASRGTRGRRPAAPRRQPGELRILDLERRRLAHLPANQLIEILRLRPAPFRTGAARTSPTRVGQDQRDAARARRNGVERGCGSPPRAPPGSCTFAAFSAGSTAPGGSGSLA